MEDGREAIDAGLTALRHRDLSAAELERRLAAKGFDEAERESAVATLRDTGLVDDARYAEARAGGLAARLAGDKLIRHDLVRAGVEREVVERIVEALEPEVNRALRIVEKRGMTAKTARYLRGKGFSEDSVRAVTAIATTGAAGVAIADDTELG